MLCALKLGAWPCSLQALPYSDTPLLPQAEPQAILIVLLCSQGGNCGS